MSGEIIVASRAKTHEVQSHGVTIVAKCHRQRLTHLPPSFIKEYAQYRVRYRLSGEQYIMSQTKLWGESFFLAAVEQVWRLLLWSSCSETFLADLKNKTKKTTVTHPDELLHKQIHLSPSLGWVSMALVKKEVQMQTLMKWTDS